jgi:predicted enzyme related to lactoylglutathione lyase
MRRLKMDGPFVWFHHRSDNPEEIASFYAKMAGWKSSDGPASMTMLAGERGPFAGCEATSGELKGWIPYLQVEDVDTATDQATALGAEVLEAKTTGPAGDFSVIRDPGGATLALWQKA